MNTVTELRSGSQGSGLGKINHALTRPVAFYPALARIAGSISAGLFLSQLLYWTERSTDGWFFESCAQWKEETSLSRAQQDGARALLRGRGFLEEKIKGAGRTNKPTVHFRVKVDAVARALEQLLKTDKCNCRKPANANAENQQMQMLKTSNAIKEAESPAENPAESFKTSSAAASAAPPVIRLPLNDRSEFEILHSDVDEWTRLYPATDVLQELRKMRGWLLANPRKRKTKSGVLRFVNAWLTKAQDETPRKRPATVQPGRNGGAYHSDRPADYYHRKPDFVVTS